MLLAVALAGNPGAQWAVLLIILVAAILGVLITIPIGGADMPVVVSLLNSYSGLAACAAGFVLHNTGLIISGSLVGASGLILTRIMCKAMNRSFFNVMAGGFGQDVAAAGATSAEGKTVRQMDAEEAAMVLEASQRVFIIPGYGMAVAQAQHAVAEMAGLLAKKGIEVKYGVHPVAGRMPGHMNVLLAEANVPYEQLADLELNSEMDQCDVALIIGANDVVNPDARRPEAGEVVGSLHQFKGILTVVSRIESLMPLSEKAQKRVAASGRTEDEPNVSYVAKITYSTLPIVIGDRLFLFKPLAPGPDRDVK